MKSIYVLYTGGTIGSAGDPLAPMSTAQFRALVNQMPGLSDGLVQGEQIRYVIDGTPQPLDSSNMTPSDWVAIAQQLAGVYADYDGFVVLHGTDTMGYTASALSFLFQGLDKTVVITGSQLPLSYTVNDALANLSGALVMAAKTGIPEVTLYFDFLLFRGNRAVKVNANAVHAFDSPNFPALAALGTQLTVQTALALPPPPAAQALSSPGRLQALKEQLQRFSAAVTEFSVPIMSLYPGINASTVEAIVNGTRPPVSGLVLLAFGAGNGPSNPAFLGALSRANAGGVVLMDNTQVLAGTVSIDAYATGEGLAKAGAISAYDMTPEASLAKLIYLRAQGLAPAEIKVQMVSDLRGEITLESQP
ncbi:asparaginase domain-containing protein [Roseateles sp. SL47]|uniref:asparaginase domain-containing protein n=1 Tax=Roseateles sp. SL47 TaxID=2995138 RepID=UPI002271E29A|nr:asparaginase domain-containing protein [Roseateles sp. SL47]WAC75099.1 asparaginase domain-containing protein [Roseateles sp. SL47]